MNFLNFAKFHQNSVWSHKDVEKQEQFAWVKEVVSDKAIIDDFVLETVQNRYNHHSFVISVKMTYMAAHGVDPDEMQHDASHLGLHHGNMLHLI